MRTWLLIPALLIGACDSPAPTDTFTEEPVTLGQRMAAAPDPGFARAVEPRAFRFPRDHGAHPDFATEWWYLTGNLKRDDGRRFGYQFTLFRIGVKPGTAADDSHWRSNRLYMGHLAVSDIDQGRHLSDERFSRAAAGLAGAEHDPLRVWLGPWTLHSRQSGQLFPIDVQAAGDDFAIDLTLDAGDKPIVLQGDEGLSRKSGAPGNASYYYSMTRLPTRGDIRVGADRFAVSGNSWLDREWSSSALAEDQAGWDWFALQLDDGRDLMFYRMRGHDGRAQRFSEGVLVAPDGSTERLSLDQVELRPERYWTSPGQARYPIGWRMALPAFGLDLEVEAVIPDQLMDHTVEYWEGAVSVRGSHSGVGYLELSGYAGSPAR